MAHLSWITVIWSAMASASVVTGLVYLLVWSRDRQTWANLCFFLIVIGALGLAAGELSMMYTDSPETFARSIRWIHLVYAIGVMGTLGFIHFYFRTGRAWLLALAVGLRMLAVLANFTTGVNLNFTAIQSLRKVTFLGEQVSTLGEWTPSPWTLLGLLASSLQIVYVVDASIRLWRTGSHEARSRALMMGGALTLFVFIAAAQSGLIVAGVLRTPITLSPPFLCVILAMGYELSNDVLRAARLSRQLWESQQQMALATEAAHLGIWTRDLSRNEIWATDICRDLLGFPKSEQFDFVGLMQRLHPDDRDGLRHALSKAEETGKLDAEYRVILASGEIRWIVSRGRIEFNEGRPVLLRGAVLDITARRETEDAARSLSGRLIHAQEAERARLARELHDDLSQSLALLSIELDMVGRGQPANGEVSECMRDLSGQVKILSSSVHRISHELHPAKLEQLGLEAAVRGFCREIGEARNLAIDFEAHDVPRDLPNDIALCFYRIVQEGLQNVVKHSGCSAAKVELTPNDKELCLIVSDQGCGFDSIAVANHGSLGLISMRERVRLVRGQISIESRRGNGTQIKVQVPL